MRDKRFDGYWWETIPGATEDQRSIDPLTSFAPQLGKALRRALNDGKCLSGERLYLDDLYYDCDFTMPTKWVQKCCRLRMGMVRESSGAHVAFFPGCWVPDDTGGGSDWSPPYLVVIDKI